MELRPLRGLPGSRDTDEFQCDLHCGPFEAIAAVVKRVTRFHTVIPIHNVDLCPEVQLEFADGYVLTALPAWIRNQALIESLSADDREVLRQATHGFVVIYEAAALGDVDPAWEGADPKSIQETKYEHGVLANLALWLSRPSPVCFIVVLHAPQFEGDPQLQQITSHSPPLCHPLDTDARITAADLDLAARLHRSLLGVSRDTAVWTAVRATWAGLQMNIEAIRYSLFWIALEALFGPEDAREITYRFSHRVAFFLAKDRAEARGLFATAKSGYAFRSKIVHGRWKEDTDSEAKMASAEGLVRRSLIQILEDAELTRTFSGTARERFLDDLLFKKGGAA